MQCACGVRAGQGEGSACAHHHVVGDERGAVGRVLQALVEQRAEALLILVRVRARARVKLSVPAHRLEGRDEDGVGVPDEEVGGDGVEEREAQLHKLLEVPAQPRRVAQSPPRHAVCRWRLAARAVERSRHLFIALGDGASGDGQHTRLVVAPQLSWRQELLCGCAAGRLCQDEVHRLRRRLQELKQALDRGLRRARELPGEHKHVAAVPQPGLERRRGGVCARHCARDTTAKTRPTQREPLRRPAALGGGQ
eukprot:scaffold40182_cov67-Phaeocystis_antarctica.AAC.5